MPHTRKRGNRNPVTYKKKVAVLKAEKTLQNQQNLVQHVIDKKAFHDLVNHEKVNKLPLTAIICETEKVCLQTIMDEAIPDVQDGSVLIVPNLYHLELFPDCNQLQPVIIEAGADEDLDLLDEFT